MTNDHVEQERLSHLLRELAAQDAGALATNTRATNGDEPVGRTDRRSNIRVRCVAAVAGTVFSMGICSRIVLCGRDCGDGSACGLGGKPTGRANGARRGPARVGDHRGGTGADSARLQGRRTSTGHGSDAAIRRRPKRRRAGEGCRASAIAEVEPFVRLLPMTEQELHTKIRLARVRLRGQAAQTLGLEARMPLPGADGFVEADVLLGEDGLARAIR